jgi:uncharacterized iron-regulated membrane protein
MNTQFERQIKKAKPEMFRQLHRWTSLPLIIVLLLVLGTGVLLQFEEIGKAGGQPPVQSNRPLASPTEEAIAAQLKDALAKARAEHPDFKPSRIELAIVEGRQLTRLAVQPRGGPYVEVDHAKGTVKAEMNPKMPLHVMLIRLHTGSFFGVGGVWIMLVASFILLFLAASGGVLYWQMWRNRAGRGHPKIFWK